MQAPLLKACLGHTNNNGPPKSARSPETIHSHQNTLTSPCQHPSTAVPEASCMASSCSSQLAAFQPPGTATTAWRHSNASGKLNFSSRAVPTRQCPEIYLLACKDGQAINDDRSTESVLLERQECLVLLFCFCFPVN